MTIDAVLFDSGNVIVKRDPTRTFDRSLGRSECRRETFAPASIEAAADREWQTHLVWACPGLADRMFGEDPLLQQVAV